MTPRSMQSDAACLSTVIPSSRESDPPHHRRPTMQYINVDTTPPRNAHDCTPQSSLLSTHANYTTVLCFLTTHEAAWYIILRASVCLSVCLSVCMYLCMSDDNFRKHRRTKFIFAHPVYLHEIRVKFVYEVIGSVSMSRSKIPQMPVHALINTGRQFSSVLARLRHSRVVRP